MEERVWIICVGGSDADGVDVEKFVGTRADVVDRIWEIIEVLKSEGDCDDDMQCEKEWIDSKDRLYGYVVFDDHHTDIEAYELAEIKENVNFYSSAAEKPIW